MTNHGEIMRRWRKDHAMTQADMAKALQLSQQVYSNFENGQNLKLDFIQKYMEVTGIDLSGSSNKTQARILEYKAKIRELQFTVENKEAAIEQLKSEISFLRGLLSKLGPNNRPGPKKK